MASLFFGAYGIAEYGRVSSNLQSKFTKAKKFQPELFGGKSGVELNLTNIQDSGISGKRKANAVVSLTILLHNL